MKNIFKLLFLFFITMVVFCIQPSSSQFEAIQSEATIQAIIPENLVLVSNSFNNVEVRSSQEKSNSDCYNKSPQAISLNYFNDKFVKSKTHSNGHFIHNLSANNQKIQQIRAP